MVDKSDDLLAFLDAADTPEVSRRVCAKPSLLAERERLADELADLPDEDDDSKPKGRMSQKSPRAELTRRLAEVDGQIAAKSQVFRFRPLSPSALKAVREAAAAAGVERTDSEGFVPHIHAAQCLAPAGLTAQDFARLRETWGIPYYDENITTVASDAARAAMGDPFASTGP